MHYYEKKIGDYHRKASRLNILQHGVYNLLMDACYDCEAFPTEEQAIDWVWAETEEEIAAVKFILKKFFNKNEDGVYIQNHIQEDLNAYKAYIAKQSTNGQKGGRPKGSKNKNKSANSSGESLQGGQLEGETQENPKPITIEPSNQEPYNQDSNGNNAGEVKTNFDPIEFSTYQVHD